MDTDCFLVHLPQGLHDRQNGWFGGGLFCGVRLVGLVVLLRPLCGFFGLNINERVSVRDRSTTVDTGVGNLGRNVSGMLGENRGMVAIIGLFISRLLNNRELDRLCFRSLM